MPDTKQLGDFMWGATFGIKLVESGYAPRNKALLIGRFDTDIKAFGVKVGSFPDFGKTIIGVIDFAEGEMKLAERAEIQEIWADEPTLDKIKELINKEEL